MKQIYKCSNCNSDVVRYPSTVRNPDRVFCSIECMGAYQQTELVGANNPNYSYGQNQSICSCGNKKDYRSEQCAVCAKRSYPKSGVESLISEYDLEKIVVGSKSLTEVGKILGVSRQTITRYVKERGVDISHFKPSRNRYDSADKLFVIGPSRMNATIRKAVVRLGLKCDDVCENPNCGIVDWNGLPLRIELHHINGNACDNRLENLQFLCPNCHSQTITYRGKKR